VKRKVALLCDFDGTIARRDVGHCFFEKYVSDRGRWEKLLEDWKIGLISSMECLSSEIEMIDAGMDELNGFIENEELDPYFGDFIDFCNNRRYEVQILSDGLDYYIDRLLMREGLGYLDFRANHLVFEGNRITGVDFPHFNTLDCSMCGNCKKAHLEKMRKKGYFIIYIGNGYSDRCPSEHADLVFAKDDLRSHCMHEEHEFVDFRNFRDVEREVSARIRG
jgi:2,3-diketo-5-methylthio-1-phosphopentane phosphatase